MSPVIHLLCIVKNDLKLSGLLLISFPICTPCYCFITFENGFPSFQWVQGKEKNLNPCGWSSIFSQNTLSNWVWEVCGQKHFPNSPHHTATLLSKYLESKESCRWRITHWHKLLRKTLPVATGVCLVFPAFLAHVLWETCWLNHGLASPAFPWLCLLRHKFSVLLWYPLEEHTGREMHLLSNCYMTEDWRLDSTHMAVIYPTTLSLSVLIH